MSFQLGSGCYATVFLSMLFDISDDADITDGSET
jgi:tRNA(Glu) U13 pseudouridine synthase TruD